MPTKENFEDIPNILLKDFSDLEILYEIGKRFPHLVFLGTITKNNSINFVYKISGDLCLAKGLILSGHYKILNNAKDIK